MATKANKAYTEALQLIEKYDTVIIHRHKNPDGDAIGSQTGLKLTLQHNFPQKKIYAVGDDPKRYGFVAGSAPDEIQDGVYEGALAIVLDSADTHLISDERYQQAKATLRFDHHIFVKKFCDQEIVDTSFESCAGLIADFLTECGLTIPQDGAQALFTGMVTDSGRFRYDSANSRTFRLAAALTEYPFSPNDVYNELYADELPMMQLRAQYTLKIQLAGDNVAYVVTTRDELHRLEEERGVDSFAISRGMVGVMSDVRGVDSWVNFTETDAGVLCELRSKKHNINSIAVKYGGGGHAKASGATVPDLEMAMKMISDLKALHRGEL